MNLNNLTNFEDQLRKSVFESRSNSGLIPSIFHQIFAKYYSQEAIDSGSQLSSSVLVRSLLILLLNGRIQLLPAREERLIRIIKNEELFFFDTNKEHEVSEKIVSGQLLFLLILSFPHRVKLWIEFISKLIERIETGDGRNTSPHLHYIFTFERCLFPPKSFKHPHPIVLSMDRISRVITHRITSRDVRIHLTRSLILSLHQHFQPYLSRLWTFLFPPNPNNPFGEKLVEFIITQAEIYRFCSSSILRKLIHQFHESPNEKVLQVISHLLPHHIPEVNKRNNEVYDLIIRSLLEKIYQSNQQICQTFSENEEPKNGRKRHTKHSVTITNNNDLSKIVNPIILLRTIMDCLFGGFRRSSSHQSVFLPGVVRCLRMIESCQIFSTLSSSSPSSSSSFDVISLRNFSTKCLQQLHTVLHPISHPLFVPLEQSEVEQIFKPEWCEIQQFDHQELPSDELLIPQNEEKEEEEEDRNDDDDEVTPLVEKNDNQSLLVEEEEEEVMIVEADKNVLGVKRKSTTEVDKLREETQEVVILKKRKLDHENSETTTKTTLIKENSKKKSNEKLEEKDEDEDDDGDDDISNIVNFDVMGDEEDFDKLDEIDFD